MKWIKEIAFVHSLLFPFIFIALRNAINSFNFFPFIWKLKHSHRQLSIGQSDLEGKVHQRWRQVYNWEVVGNILLCHQGLWIYQLTGPSLLFGGGQHVIVWGNQLQDLAKIVLPWEKETDFFHDGFFCHDIEQQWWDNNWTKADLSSQDGRYW